MTGTWSEADAILSAQKRKNAWHPYRITRIEDESDVIRSFYLQPDDGLLPFEAGQHLTIRLNPEQFKGLSTQINRTYTLSSAPGDPHYRISVKREPGGLVSDFLHQSINVGDIIEARSPSGDFRIDPAEKRPAVLIAAGVGITPMISMASHIHNEGIRSRHQRQLTVIHSARTTHSRAFFKEFQQLSQQSSGTIRYCSVIQQPEPGELHGSDYHGSGYLSRTILQQLLALDDYDFYLCGPPTFMQSTYEILLELGVADNRIMAEAFGPAGLQRRTETTEQTSELAPEAEQAVIRFIRSGFEQRWDQGDANLLEVAQAHGLNPDFSCRNGNCGTCAVKLKAGSVTYRNKPTASCGEDEVLLCCAVPARGTETVDIDL